MKFQLILIVTKLIDICPVPLDNMNQIFIVEQGDGILEKKDLFETVWKLFYYQQEKGVWLLNNVSKIYLPRISEVSLFNDNSKIHTILQSNFNEALYYLLLRKKGDNKSFYVESEPRGVTLSISSGSDVVIPQEGYWSTPFLFPNRCLFNPAIISFNNGKVAIAANSADAASWIFYIEKQNVIEKKSIKNCVEPKIIGIDEGFLLFSRQSPQDWPLYYKRPSTRMAPELLPIILHKLNNSFTITETISNISNGWFTGPSFVYDVCITNDGSIFLATVTGILQKPLLQILISQNHGETWSEKTSIDLQEVPYRMKISTNNSHILVTCVFKKSDGYHITAAEIER